MIIAQNDAFCAMVAVNIGEWLSATAAGTVSAQKQ
jgi:hypothetical protein